VEDFHSSYRLDLHFNPGCPIVLKTKQKNFYEQKLSLSFSLFVNKMDSKNAHFSKRLESIKYFQGVQKILNLALFDDSD